VSAARKILKVVRDPHLAAAILNAQVRMRRKATVPLSVRLYGRVHFRAGGDVKFGDGVSLVGTVVPIEIVSHEGSQISIGDHTFINYGASITAYREVSIGRHCLLGHHLRIIDRNEHGIEQRETPPRIGRNSAIGAGSVVTKDVPANCIAAGNPARVLRSI
jgi:acetyltransferase-like isoleucine patch superfamily enzyme